MNRHQALRPQAWDWPGPRVLLEEPYDGETAKAYALRTFGGDEVLASTSNPELIEALRRRNAIPVTTA
jgi:hypothetical protein